MYMYKTSEVEFFQLYSSYSRLTGLTSSCFDLTDIQGISTAWLSIHHTDWHYNYSITVFNSTCAWLAKHISAALAHFVRSSLMVILVFEFKKKIKKIKSTKRSRNLATLLAVLQKSMQKLTMHPGWIGPQTTMPSFQLFSQRLQLYFTVKKIPEAEQTAHSPGGARTRTFQFMGPAWRAADTSNNLGQVQRRAWACRKFHDCVPPETPWIEKGDAVVRPEILVMPSPCSHPFLWTSASAVYAQQASSVDECSVLSIPD